MQKNLIETFLSIAKLKPHNINKYKITLNKCAKIIFAYIDISLELTTFKFITSK